jgi:hypothetical protein
MNSSKPILPTLVLIFAVLVALNTALVTIAVCKSMNPRRSLDEKAQISTKDLSAVLGDPFSMGEYDHLQQIIDSAQKSDPDLAYAIVMSPDGRAVATTEATFKNVRLTRNDFEREALRFTDFSLRQGEQPNIVETAMPIKTAGGQAGIIRLGFSTVRIEANDSMAIRSAAVLGFLSVLVSTIIFAVLAKSLLNRSEPAASSKLVS